MSDRLSPQREAEITERLAEARRAAAEADWPLAEYQAIKQQQADTSTLLAELAAVRGELTEAIGVTEVLNRRLSEEMLAGSGLYAALTMPTTPEQLQAALDEFTAVARRTAAPRGGTR